ncbi:MAG: RdgB/HAM1 family non-canonical purine NTP pyrophosphatase [Ferruginibacter sp.]
MQSLIFATNNQHKVDEVKSVLNGIFEVVTLKDAGINIDIPEPFDTLEENALQKSSTIHRLTNKNCFSEDTGLEVFALNGAPGVKSARYAGEQASFSDNVQKLLTDLEGIQHREARFRTVISLILNNKEYQFEGICNGKITMEASGEKGFGYDPVFIPDGDNRCFADMTMEEKNQYSHRQKAMTQLISFLKSQDGQN